MAKSTTYYLRKSHRWLGVIIGIQFLAWTVSGLYFSWNDIDEIHGDHLRNFPEPDIEIQGVISPSQIAADKTGGDGLGGPAISSNGRHFEGQLPYPCS
jgi:hypothetical protein